MAKIPFLKPVLTISEQLALLTQRGMTIADRDMATHCLRAIGYYRLSGYWFPFQYRDGSPNQESFYPGTSFDNIVDRYVFDRKLRLLIMDAIERIEVAARAVLSNSMSERHGAHWFVEPVHFDRKFNHAEFMVRVRRDTGLAPFRQPKQSEPIKHYMTKYSGPSDPPSWMVFEVLSFGSVSMVFAALHKTEQKAVAAEFGIPPKRLVSWLHAASHLRNLCAHHSRVWNREFVVTPSIPRHERGHVGHINSLYSHAVALQLFLKDILNERMWGASLKALIAEHPEIPVHLMGFSAAWEAEPLWS